MILKLIPSRTRMSPAERRYFAVAEHGHRLIKDLDATTDPARRAVILDNLAGVDATLAGIPIDEENSSGLSESLTASAGLFRLLAETERGLGHGLTDTRPNYGTFCHRLSLDGLCPGEVELWAELAMTVDRRDRAALILRIYYEYAAERVGGRAAEVLVRVAASEERAASTAGPRRWSSVTITALLWLCVAVCMALLAGWTFAEYVYGADAPARVMVPLIAGAALALLLLRQRRAS